MTRPDCRSGLTIVLSLALCAFGSTASADDGGVPLGDGNVSDGPQRDHVFSCEQSFESRPGATKPFGPWIKGEIWYPDEKPFLPGNVIWSEGGVQIKVSGDTRRITSRGVPDHGTGEFPIPQNSDLYQYDRNPNTISERNFRLNLPANPKAAASPSCLPMGPIGIALTGAAIFNALDAVGLDAAAHEIQDECSGHPAGRGNYHYHSGSDCLTETAGTSNGHSGLVGYALDGFGLYGLKGEGGAHLSNADLDACHGHEGEVVWDGQTVRIYHYHLTDEYPYTLGCFHGSPVDR